MGKKYKYRGSESIVLNCRSEVRAGCRNYRLKVAISRAYVSCSPNVRRTGLTAQCKREFGVAGFRIVKILRLQLSRLASRLSR